MCGVCQLEPTPTEKLVIIPDIHNRCDAAEEIIQREEPDRVLFLGDYFDSFDDTVEDAGNTARWLAKSLQQKNRIHLIGNHDLNYMTENPNIKCTGYSPDKHIAIDRCHIEWKKLEIYCWVDDWLITHAGLSRKFYEWQRKKNDTVQNVIRRARHDIVNIDDMNITKEFLQAGVLRGGINKFGGIVWCDYGEFEDIPDIKQVFGHTRGTTVRHQKTENSEHYCIDTHLGHYATYQNHTMSIKQAIK